jgi:hypothetical protein
MRWNTFSRSLAFAALVAAGFLPWWTLASPIVGGRAAVALYLVGAVAVYLAGLAGGLRRRLATLLVAGGAGSGVAILAQSTAELAAGLALILAVGRSGLLFRAPAARGAAVEALLAIGGLAFARFLSGPSPIGLVLAIWGFFLVQSLYFLIGGIRLRRRASRRDPFEEAHARALALLGDSARQPAARAAMSSVRR